MSLLCAALLLSLTSSARAAIPTGETPESYWNRSYSCSQSAESHGLSFRAVDIDGLASKIDSVMSAGGASVQPNGGSYGASGTNQRYRQISYSVPVKSAEKLAKKLMDMAEMTNYSLNRFNGTEALKQIEERIAVLEAEVKDNESALAKMPSADYFLTARLKALKQSRDACQSVASKGSISVMIQSKPPEPKL